LGERLAVLLNVELLGDELLRSGFLAMYRTLSAHHQSVSATR